MTIDEHSAYIDAWFVLLVFTWPPLTVFLGFILREWWSLRAQRRRDQTEAEAMAAEGYPPPDPPTTDS